MNAIEVGIDVMDRIERIEKLRDEVKQILQLNQSVADRNVFTVDQVIKYAEKISGSVSQQPTYPIMPNATPYPDHINNRPFPYLDLLENVGWTKVDDLLNISNKNEEEPIQSLPIFMETPMDEPDDASSVELL
ncbi:hypothetical protein QTN25_008096 [Entamoeba marina]